METPNNRPQATFHIEFAHSYADEKFGDEQRQAAEELKKYIADRVDQSSFITSVLIDEFNPRDLTLNIPEFITTIESLGTTVDFVAYESKFVSIADQLIAEIPREQLRFEHFHEREVVVLKDDERSIGLKEFSFTTQKHTCAILSAAWTLCRLGAYQFPVGSITAHPEKIPAAEKIITILPKKYQATEEKMKQIIASTRFAPLLSRVEHIYF